MKGSTVEVTIHSKQGRKHVDEVRDALNEFKKQMKKSGIMEELRKREHYTAPSKARRLKRNESIKQRKRDERKEEWQRRKNNDL